MPYRRKYNTFKRRRPWSLKRRRNVGNFLGSLVSPRCANGLEADKEWRPAKVSRLYAPYNIHHFVRAGDNGNISIPTTAALGRGVGITLNSNVSGGAQIAALYEQFSIDLAEFKFELRSNIYSDNQIDLIPNIWICKDLDDIQAPSDVGDVENKAGARKYSLAPGKPLYFRLKPRPNTQMWISPTATGYGVPPPNQRIWCDTNSNNIVHYGVKYWITGTANTQIQVSSRYWISVKGCRGNVN